MNSSFCPLCGKGDPYLFFEDKKRSYLRCSRCQLVFVPKNLWLSDEAEKAIYDLHNNDPEDSGYRQFLSRLSTPLSRKLDSNQKGLDFGSGPGPTLSLILEDNGHHVDLFDPFYHYDPSVFQKTYDFICATEVVEHFHDPIKEFIALFEMLRQGGWLGIMTKLVIDKNAFSSWHYILDMTHVCFYNLNTFEYLAKRFNAEFILVEHDVLLFQKR